MSSKDITNIFKWKEKTTGTTQFNFLSMQIYIEKKAKRKYNNVLGLC